MVLAQVGLSVFLFNDIYVIAHQLNYMQTKNLGISPEQVLVIRLDELDNAHSRYEAFDRWKTTTSNLKNVKSVGGGYAYPGEAGADSQSYFRTNNPERKPTGFPLYSIIGEYPETLDMQLLEGKTFDSSLTNDSTKVIISESAAHDLGFASPSSAFGQEITMRRPVRDHDYSVIGVIKDFSTSTKELTARHHLASWAYPSET